MFHFPSLPLTLLFIQREMTGHYSSRVSPFGNPRIEAWLAAPRGFSQPPTTFIGFWCLGIRHLHLLICFYIYYKDARVHCVVLKIRAILGKLAAYLNKFKQFDFSLGPEGSYPQDPTTRNISTNKI